MVHKQYDGAKPVSNARLSQATMTWRWLLGLTLLALIVRIIGLNSSLWLDEIYSVIDQFRLSPVQLFTTFTADTQHPLYAILASISMSVFGEHAWSARLPALVFGVAAVPALYFLGRRVGGSRNEALLATALLALSYHHVWFSQNARGYSAIAFAAILCTDRFLCLLKDKNRRDIGLYAIIAALGCYAHLTMVFIVVGQFIAFLLWLVFQQDPKLRISSWQQPILAFVLSGLLTLLLYAPVFTQVIDFFVNKPSGMKEISTHAWALAETFRSLSIGWGSGFVVIAGCTTMLVGIASFYRRNKLALGIFVSSIAVTFLVAFFARGTMYPRFFFFLAGFFLLIGVRGVMVTVVLCTQWMFHGDDRQKNSERLAIAAMLVVIAVSAFSMMRNYQYPKMDFEGARQWIESQVTAEDVIVTAGVTALPYNDYYGVNWPEMKTAADIQSVTLGEGGNLWIVYAFARYMKDEGGAPEVYDIINRDCVDAKHFYGTLGGGAIIACRLQLNK